jgi:hypothetical protein
LLKATRPRFVVRPGDGPRGAVDPRPARIGHAPCSGRPQDRRGRSGLATVRTVRPRADRIEVWHGHHGPPCLVVLLGGHILDHLMGGFFSSLSSAACGSVMTKRSPGRPALAHEIIDFFGVFIEVVPDSAVRRQQHEPVARAPIDLGLAGGCGRRPVARRTSGS